MTVLQTTQTPAPYDTGLDRNAANFQPLTPLSFLARAAEVYADHTAIIHGARSWTYREFFERAKKLASALAKRGIKRGDTVSVVLPNVPAMLEAHYGVAMAGAVLNSVNTRLDATIIAFTFDHGEAKVLITDREYSKTVKTALSLCKAKPLVIDYDDPEFTGPGERLGTLDYEQLLSEGEADFAWLMPRDEWDAIALNYTSGTTGDPKGVKHIHTTPMAAARLMGQRVIGIRENDVVFSAAKLFFSYGMGNAMAFPLSVGATTVLLPQRPTPEAVFDIMRRHRPTIFYGVPTLYASLLAHKDMTHGAGSDRLRLCVSAGEALPGHLGKRWRAAAGVDVLDGIGSTEMFQTFLSNQPGDVRYGTTGKPVPGYDLKIVDEEGREVADGEIGELVVRGPTAGEGYWNQRAKSRRTFAGEWTFTGDKYVREAGGYYHYCGRTDDMFKVSGMWVSPFEVEAALASHEAVLEAAVIGKEDADGLIKPKAFIVLRNGYAADERLIETLRVHVKECAGPWKYPRWIDVRPDLPRTATGKIQRFKLRELES